MSEPTIKGPTTVVAKSTVILHLPYPDGSKIQLTMPRPPGLLELSREQAEMTLHRMATRLLTVALEDLAAQKKGGRP